MTARRRETKSSHELRSVLLLLALLLTMLPASAASSAAPPAQTESARVDDQVWRDLAAAADHRVTFTVVMHETQAGHPESAISAQMELEAALAILQDLGSVDGYRARYGANEIVVTGSRSALRLLAGWPSVAAIQPYDPLQARQAVDQSPVGGEATGQITGLVTGPNGTTPLSGIRVTAFRQATPTTWSVAGTATSASNGAYSIGGLATGIYRAKFESTTGVYVTEYYNNKLSFNLATNFSVTDGQSTSGIDASLAQAGSIAGRVTDVETGETVADVVATAWINEGGVWRQASIAVTANTGLYTLGGLAGGQAYRVKFGDGVAPPRFLEEYYDNVTTIAAATPVNVVGGQVTPNINAAMGSYGKIGGAVTGPDGVTPAANIDVDVYQFNTTLGQWEWVSGDATTAAGLYTATGLVTDNYRLYFSDPVNFFVAEYYNNKPELAVADNVAVQLGLTTSGINASLALATVQVSRPLVSGWNLVAPPVAPVDPAPAAALGSIGGSYNLVYAYQGCDTANPWKKYDPYAPPFVNDLTAIDPRFGNWLNMTAPGTWSLTGAWPQIVGIALCPGWNLIGYPKQSPVPVETALAGIAGKYNLVYGYNAADTANPWKKYDPGAPPFTNDLTHLQAWSGYWIRMTQAATLIVTNR